jgi:hypothetical protein
MTEKQFQKKIYRAGVIADKNADIIATIIMKEGLIKGVMDWNIAQKRICRVLEEQIIKEIECSQLENT